MSKPRNLDLLAAQTAQAIIADTMAQKKPAEVENLITKALGVLQENGVYAGLLYLYSRSNVTDEPIARQTRARLLSLIPEVIAGVPAVTSQDARTALKYMTDTVCNDLDTLLLLKQVWEQTLIYARYGAKARGAEEETKTKKIAEQKLEETIEKVEAQS